MHRTGEPNRSAPTAAKKDSRGRLSLQNLCVIYPSPVGEDGDGKAKVSNAFPCGKPTPVGWERGFLLLEHAVAVFFFGFDRRGGCFGGIELFQLDAG